MANQAPDKTNFFRQATANRLAMVPGAAMLANWGSPSAAAALNSRVLASQTNGAQSPSDPSKAPWTFTDFIFGTRSVAWPVSPTKSNRGMRFSPKG